MKKSFFAGALVLALLLALFPGGAMETEAASKTTIETVSAGSYAISAKVSLDGSGTGYHAKLVMGNDTSAVSFGLQYDKYCRKEKYRSKAAFMIENVKHNEAGGQKYTWLKAGKKKTTYTLMMVLNPDTGEVKTFVNGKKIGSVTNSRLVGSDVYARVEGSARINGDRVIANFSNIKIKKAGSAYHSADQAVQWVNLVANQSGGIKAYDADTMDKIYERQQIFPSDTTVLIKGKLKNVDGDWDSNYEDCSAIVNMTTYTSTQAAKVGYVQY